MATRGSPVVTGPAVDVGELLDNAPLGAFHRRAVLVSGVGFFTDAYDLFVISTVAALASVQWHLDATQTNWINGSAILGAVGGALLFGRLADLIGRRRVYAVVAFVMIVGALLSAIAPNVVVLVAARLLLGFGIGGDYPVSAVLTSEYANRDDRGRLVGMVFSMQALGLVVGPLVALALVETHVPADVAWRVLLGLGALPAAAVIYLRTTMPESPRFEAAVRGASRAHEALSALLPGESPAGRAPSDGAGPARAKIKLAELLRDRHLRTLVVATAGCWFLFDYAYYGNTLSLPVILKSVDPRADLAAKLLWSLGMFVVFAVPGYAVAVWRMDRIGHRRLQLGGFAVLTAAFLLLAAVPELTTTVGAFLAVFGLSYFFVEFGPNMTTFVLPSEVFPTRARTTGHGFAAGIGKLGAFLGVFLVPALETRVGLRGMLAIAGAFAIAGLLLTRRLPEPARRGLEDVSSERTQQPTVGAEVAAGELQELGGGVLDDPAAECEPARV